MGDVVAVTVPVAECFGPVWQGEGPAAGRRASFLRLGLCNLTCEWCDTPYTWDHTRYDVKAECPPRDAAWITATLALHHTRLLVVTGGEPLLHANNPTMIGALQAWDAGGGTVHVETNGTRPPAPDWPVALWVVSPKINTRDPAAKRALHLAWPTNNSVGKFVCRTARDVDLAADVSPWAPDRTWIMPEGVDTDTVLATARRLAPHVERHGFNLTLRQHTLLYGTERAR